MGQVLKAYLGLCFLLLMGLVGIGVVAAGIEAAAARDYHADAISEIECSNFNASVISACKSQAKSKGPHPDPDTETPITNTIKAIQLWQARNLKQNLWLSRATC